MFKYKKTLTFNVKSRKSDDAVAPNTSFLRNVM